MRIKQSISLYLWYVLATWDLIDWHPQLKQLVPIFLSEFQFAASVTMQGLLSVNLLINVT